MGSHGSDLGGTPLPFSFSQTPEDGKGQYFVHLQSSVSSWVSIIFQVSILSSFLVSKNTVGCEWGEQWCVLWTSVTSLCLISFCVLASQTLLKVRWWMSEMRRWTVRKLGLVGTQRSCLFLPSALCHGQLYPSHSWQRDKHLSNLFQCLPCSLFCSPCSFF